MEIFEKENPENFDDGLTQVAPKGEFKPMKGKRYYCRECEKELTLLDNQDDYCNDCVPASYIAKDSV